MTASKCSTGPTTILHYCSSQITRQNTQQQQPAVLIVFSTRVITMVKATPLDTGKDHRPKTHFFRNSVRARIETHLCIGECVIRISYFQSGEPKMTCRTDFLQQAGSYMIGRARSVFPHMWKINV